MPGPHVLLVEDSRFITQAVCDKLSTHHGFETSVAETAAEAREVLATADIDCILVKHKLPDETGLEFAGSVDAAIPIVLVTSSPLEEVAPDAIDAGITEFYPKDELGTETMAVLANRITVLVDAPTLQN